jgi:RsiW-degrading membrane proteinase PrsW (M82 family)
VPITVLQVIFARFPVFNDRRLVALLATALLFHGLVEESIKMLSLFLIRIGGKGREADKSRGVFMFLGALQGLTLGCFETLVYFITGHSNILLRLCTAMLIHTACAALSSLTVWSCKQGERRIAPFISAGLVHGTYNFFSFFPPPLRWFSLAAILLGAIQCRVHWVAGRESELG